MTKKYTNDGREYVGGACCAMFFIVIINIFVGALCFDYSLMFYFGKDVPLWADIICGMVASPVVVPAAIIALILSVCGVKIV